ncbi:MAG: hypothetical protein RL757_2497 [Bacteroidota bacterium]|jgi:lipoprotein signal peptidase
MANNVVFYLGLSFILMHEMDAIRCKEWRILPITSFLNDKIGYFVFLFLHIPIFYWILYMLIDNPNNHKFIIGLDYFFIIHVVLHLLFLKHKKNEFKDYISWSIIVGAGLCGLIDIMIKTMK